VAPAPEGARTVEIRSYNLKPGVRERFHRRVLDEALPILKRFEIDVVAFGPSAHDADSYFVVRSFLSPADRDRREDAFYSSEEWKKGPREAVLADIDSYTTVVVTLDAATVEGLRRAGTAP
jgi:hypothetical protein